VSTRTTAVIPADFGKPSVERTGPAAALPFGAIEKEATETLVVHFKVLTDNPVERLEVARLVQRQLIEQRVGSKDVTFIVTGGDEVESAVISLRPLVAQIVAEVKKTLGIR
jgi:hypothetical protein